MPLFLLSITFSRHKSALSVLPNKSLPLSHFQVAVHVLKIFRQGIVNPDTNAGTINDSSIESVGGMHVDFGQIEFVLTLIQKDCIG